MREWRTSNSGRFFIASNGNWCSDRSVALIILNLEIVKHVVEQAGRLAPDIQGRQGIRSARELQLRLLEVVKVQMTVTPRPDEFAQLQVALVGDHVGEQCVGGDVERHAEQCVGAALV